MLPVYLSYFAGESTDEEGKKKTQITRILAFILGFTIVFTALGLFAGSLGTLLAKYQKIVNIVSGIIVVIFGLSYLELIRLPMFKGMKNGAEVKSVFSALLFGIVYSVSLTPCVGAFLGSALMLASSAGGALQGTLLLLCYSLGLGVPFFMSALLMERLGSVFVFIKKHYKVINTVCGIFLILMGVLIAFGLMNKFFNLFM